MLPSVQDSLYHMLPFMVTCVQDQPVQFVLSFAVSEVQFMLSVIQESLLQFIVSFVSGCVVAMARIRLVAVRTHVVMSRMRNVMDGTK